MREQYAKAYDGISSDHIAKRINADIEENRGHFHIVTMTKIGVDDGVIVIWEGDDDIPAK